MSGSHGLATARGVAGGRAHPRRHTRPGGAAVLRGAAMRKIRARVLALIPNPNLRHLADGATGRRDWTGAVDEQGNGTVGTGRHGTFRAPRVAYERRYGPIPPGLQPDHRCRNRRWVNPEHLGPVTDAEHRRRGTKAKLTRAAVRLIRASGTRGSASPAGAWPRSSG